MYSFSFFILHSNPFLHREQSSSHFLLKLQNTCCWQFITFPECVEQLFERCLNIINRDLEELGLSTVEVVVHEKRNINQGR